jgi:hypothetical protein
LIFKALLFLRKVHWIPKALDTGELRSNLRDGVHMRILQDTSFSPESRRLTLEFTGPPQMNLVLSPKSSWEANITIQTLMDSTQIEKEGSNRWKRRKVYYIYHGRGYQPEPLRINIELTRISESGDDNDTLLEMQHTGLYLNLDENSGTPQFFDFLNRFPSWAYTGMSWSSVVKMYRIE